MNYYNEWDNGAAAWLRELIKAGLIPQGYVDERSITEVTPGDLEGFTQCHFFAGIGGWSLALQLAGVPATARIWTGSPPCQPFSVAGKQLGQLDERHLAPTFMRLVTQCRPAILFGEQVAAAIGKHWLDDLFTELEREGYACGASVLPAASIGAPHKRDRLFFGAVNELAYSASARHLRGESATIKAGREKEPGNTGELPARSGGCALPDIQQGTGVGSVAHTDDARSQGWEGVPERADKQSAGAAGVAGELAHTVRQQFDGSGAPGQERRGKSANSGIADATDPHHGFWSNADWLGCRDGKFRPVEPGTFPLADGIPARVGRLRGYGNAIVPQVAAEFIKAFAGAIRDTEQTENPHQS